MKNWSISLLAGAALADLGATAALAQTPAAAAAPTIFLDSSNVIATGSIISLNRLPIKLPSGAIIYKDVTIQLNSDAVGLVSDVSPIVQSVSPVLPNSFRAGIYVLPTSPAYGFALTGPSAVPGRAVSKWEVNPTAGKGEGASISGVPAIFYVGALSNNPFYATRLQPAGITNPEYSYGIVGSPAEGGRPYSTNTIVGFSQSGGQLSIASFTDANGRDQNVPVVTRTYSLQQP